MEMSGLRSQHRFLSSGIGSDGLEGDFNRIQDVLQNLFSFFIAPERGSGPLVRNNTVR
jgi:hypothetical protein